MICRRVYNGENRINGTTGTTANGIKGTRGRIYKGREDKKYKEM
jgi:hypothetical protein